ncbi:hypothetical protein JHK82_026684 [Glycine max]|nr:hypothetical protein JHK85_027304 [Glycine max]KAG5002665.1 hypothetical protein JHK86_026804 [Glycine max]KAG5125849.1 hypothetical protein JHK82_026684 [Glycine max]
MDLYGRGPARNVHNPVNQPEWRSPGTDTGLEESMWHLTLGGGGESYPERPGVPNCVYYMRTGVCGYGGRCRYNHPHDRAAVVAAVRVTGDYPERLGEPPCQYYLKTGTCKFGASCKFHHPKNGGEYLSQAPLNVYGYPLRSDEKECSYYLKTGQCKYGISCKFHHPQPAGTSLPASAAQFYQQVQSPTVPLPEQYVGASSSLRVARPPILPGSYVQGAYGPVFLSPGVVQFPGWNHYSALPGTQPGVGATSLYGVTQLSSPTSAFARPYTLLPSSTGLSGSNLKEQLYPKRPGEPDCQYYLRTGDCKFGLACQYHHPQDHVVAQPLLSPVGLPLRPRTFGLNWPELMSGSKKESFSARIPSSGNSSGTSVGLIFSQGGSVLLSDVQLSSQSSAPTNSSRSTRQSEPSPYSVQEGTSSSFATAFEYLPFSPYLTGL